MQLRNFEEAIADLKASLQGNVEAASADLDSKSNLISTYYDLGQAMLDLGEYDDALEYHTEVLNLADSNDDKVEIFHCFILLIAFFYPSINGSSVSFLNINWPRCIIISPLSAVVHHKNQMNPNSGS